MSELELKRVPRKWLPTINVTVITKAASVLFPSELDFPATTSNVRRTSRICREAFPAPNSPISTFSSDESNEQMHQFAVGFASCEMSFLPHFEAIKAPRRFVFSFPFVYSFSAILCCTCVMKCTNVHCDGVHWTLVGETAAHGKWENCWYASDCLDMRIWSELPSAETVARCTFHRSVYATHETNTAS